LLSRVANDPKKVEPANSTSNGGNLVGVAADEPLLALSSGGARDAQVVTGGTTEVLVSDLAGDVKSGDKITASPLSGIGVKAVMSGEVVGTAQSDLGKAKTVKRQVTDRDGKQRDVKVGLLPVAVNVTYYSSGTTTDKLADFVPDALQTAANAVAGRPVAPVKVILSSLSLMIGFIIVTVILYSAVRSGVISIGRNPLAYSKLRRGIIDVIIGAIAILILSGVVAYALLIT
jgi:hypothetical protein